MTFFLHLKCLSKSDYEINVVSRFSSYWNSRVRWWHEEITNFIYRIVKIDEFHIYTWSHYRISSHLSKRKEIFNLSALIRFDSSSLMWHIDKCIKFFFSYSIVSMKVNFSSEHPSETFHKELYKPSDREKEPHKYLVSMRHLKCDCIRKSDSNNFWCNFPKKKNRKKSADINDSSCKMIRNPKSLNYFRGNIFFCHKRWSTGYQ